MYQNASVFASIFAPHPDQIPTLHPLKASAVNNFYVNFAIFLSSSTKLKFGKNLVRIWVELDRKMVYGNQGVG